MNFKPYTLILLALLCACAQTRQPETARKPSTAECQAIAKKIAAKKLYDEIDKTDMTVFDGVASRDPHTIDPRLLHQYLVLDKYAKEHNTTLSRMTPMERRQVLLDDAVNNEGASNVGLTPDESNTAAQCAASQ